MRDDRRMDPSEMHDRVQSVFESVLVHVSDADLDTRTPCTEWTVADLTTHVVAGNERAAGLMGGSLIALPDGDRVARHRAAATQAMAAFSAPGWQERTVELPFGELPAPVYAAIRAGDVYVHAWDLAAAIGVDTDLDGELGEAIRAATAPVVSPELRGDGRPFGPEQPCPADRPTADQLAAFFGRVVEPSG